MGWISVGLLLLSGGCILYRHPPGRIVQIVLGLFPSCPRSGSRRRPSEEKDASKKKEIERESGRKVPSINAPDSIPLENESTANESAKSTSHGTPRQATAANASKTPVSTIHETGTQPKSPPNVKSPSPSAMPPPPRPITNAPLRPPPSAASSLRVPAAKPLSNTTLAPSRLAGAPTKPSRKVILSPGHSPLDWAALISDPRNDLRGKDAAAAASSSLSSANTLIRVRPSLLKQQNGRRGRDTWTEYQGKIYNITPYLPFHPGGEGELMRGAGRDAGKLFMEVHPWVNWEAMLGECLVGILVEEYDVQRDPSTGGAANLDEMD